MDKRIKDDESMFSFDAMSLFTFIDLNLAKEPSSK